MSLDFYLQGFCVTSLALRQSAFYGAAMHRTAVLRPWLQWHNASSPAARQLARTAEQRGNRTALRSRRRCALPAHAELTQDSAPQMPADFCLQRACRLRACNNVQ